MFCFFGPEACGILAPWPGIEHSPPALEGEVLATGPPGMSLHYPFNACKNCSNVPFLMPDIGNLFLFSWLFISLKIYQFLLMDLRK